LLGSRERALRLVFWAQPFLFFLGKLVEEITVVVV
jgi:hypothetical protein